MDGLLRCAAWGRGGPSRLGRELHPAGLGVHVTVQLGTSLRELALELAKRARRGEEVPGNQIG